MRCLVLTLLLLVSPALALPGHPRAGLDPVAVSAIDTLVSPQVVVIAR